MNVRVWDEYMFRDERERSEHDSERGMRHYLQIEHILNN